MGYPILRPGGEQGLVVCPKCNCTVPGDAMSQDKHEYWHKWLDEKTAQKAAESK